MTRFSKFGIAALAVSGMLVAGPAGAVAVVIPAATGHWLPVTGQTQASLFEVDNSYVCFNEALHGTAFWHTPLVLYNKTSAGSVTITQYLYNYSTNAKSKGYSFAWDGVYFSSTGSWTSSNNVGSLSMPTDGTALLVTQLNNAVAGTGADCLASVKVSW